MDGIQYDNSTGGLRRLPYAPEEPALIRRLVAWGIASSPQQAQYILLGVVALALPLILYFSAKAFYVSDNYSTGELGAPIIYNDR